MHILWYYVYIKKKCIYFFTNKCERRETVAKQNIRAGGFAAVNSGEISNCYTIVSLGAKGKNVGGFVGENSGNISKSFSYNSLNGLTAGFSGGGKGKDEDACYFFHAEKENSKKVTKYPDSEKGQRIQEIREIEDIQSLGYDVTKIWTYDSDKKQIQFQIDNWYYDIRKSVKWRTSLAETGEEPRAVSIKDADQLFALAEKINAGDKALAAAYIKLENDIDLDGREWIPIGIERTGAFTGLFDGEGHTIRNLSMKDKDVENKGFFGFLKGEVFNVSIECHIKKAKGYAGGIAAHNEGGTIGCCGAIVEIQGKEGNLGGLVGRNSGNIFHSYVAGRVKAIIIPWIWGIPIVGAVVIVAVLSNLPDGILPTGNNLPQFAPPAYDEDQVPIGDALTPNAEGNFVSFQFEQDIKVDLATGLCKFNFLNPGNSNHDVVVQLHFTDAQAVRVLGSTGRSAEAQAELEATPGYDPETYRTVIAESKAIRPGYQLSDLRLVVHENGAKLPAGSYNAMVYLIFYDIVTHNRAMLESQLPVVITVQ